MARSSSRSSRTASRSFTRFLPERFTILLLVTVTLASLLPASGRIAQGLDW